MQATRGSENESSPGGTPQHSVSSVLRLGTRAIRRRRTATNPPNWGGPVIHRTGVNRLLMPSCRQGVLLPILRDGSQCATLDFVAETLRGTVINLQMEATADDRESAGSLL